MRKILFLVLLFLLPSVVQAATLDVGPGRTYSTIGAAVSAASNNDTIVIYNGTYREQVSTAKTGLTFQGESEAGVVWSSMVVAVGTPSWSKTAGRTNIYQCTATDVAASTVAGAVDEDRLGMYRRKSSLDDVDAIPGTHYTTGGTLYVHCSDGASPATHTMWWTTAEYSNLFRTTGGGALTLENITFVGATQYGVWVDTVNANAGTVTVTNCTFRCFASATTNGGMGLHYDIGDTAAGTFTVTDSEFLYNCSPTYDSNYAIFTDAQSNTHPYQGIHMGATRINQVNITNCVFRYAREAIDMPLSVTMNIKRSLITDTCVHPIFFACAANSVMTIENSIHSMYGSTTGCDNSSTDGFQVNLYNNTVYTGENTVNGTGNKMFFTAQDPDDDCYPNATYEIFNNLFIADADAGTAFLDLAHATLANISIDYNYYYGTYSDIIRYSTCPNSSTAYTLAEWQTFTDGEGHSRSDNSVYDATLGNANMSVEDYEDTGNVNFGKILTGSPVIDQASGTYAPSVDKWGTSRPSGAADDIGAHEFADACIDNDSDGYGSPASALCAEVELDCDDTDGDVNPGVGEEGPVGYVLCTNGKDDDCDGLIDTDDPGCLAATTGARSRIIVIH